VNETSRAQNTNSDLDWEPHSVRWAGFGPVPAEDVNQIYIYASSMELTRTAPLVLGILESDHHNLSFGQQQIKKLHTTYVYRNICMIAMRGSKIATSYHDIGSRFQHRRTAIEDQSHQPSDYYDFLVWTYPAFDEVACAFPDPELCRSKVRGTGVRGAKGIATRQSRETHGY
jgi:hypothetical protein